MSWNAKTCGQSKRRYLYVWNVETRKHEYVGRGPTAEKLDRQLTERRIKKAEQLAAWEYSQQRVDEASDPLDHLCHAATTLMRVVLVAAGFHLHARTEWRRRAENVPEVSR